MDIKTRTRIIKPVEREDFLTGEQIDEAMVRAGISERILAQDDEDGNFLNLMHTPFLLEEAAIEVNETKYIVTASRPSEGGKIYIADFLNDEMDAAAFRQNWEENEDFKRVVSALMRYPGNMHEWLMIKELPTFKEMGIDFNLVKQVRTTINQGFQFLYNGKAYTHGNNTGSSMMHRKLSEYIQTAYEEFCAGGGDPVEYLQALLQAFTDEFFNDECKIPKELYIFAFPGAVY